MGLKRISSSGFTRRSRRRLLLAAAQAPSKDVCGVRSHCSAEGLRGRGAGGMAAGSLGSAARRVEPEHRTIYVPVRTAIFNTALETCCIILFFPF